MFHIPTNDHDGADTLHGGIYGWDRRAWTLTHKTQSADGASVTYVHYDQGDEGFPGIVVATVRRLFFLAEWVGN